MALKKLIYFTATDVPTAAEKEDIAKLNAAAIAPYEIAVRSSQRPLKSGGPLEFTNCVSGTMPTEYAEGYEFVDPDNIPVGGITDTQVILNDGEELAVEGGGTVSVAISNGVATYTYTPAA